MSENYDYRPVEMEEGVPVVHGEEATVASVSVVPMIEIVAPATLSEGYAFDCQVGDRVITVTVPQGGIEEGQRFMVPAKDVQGSQRNSIPVGAWKDGLCNCFKYGCHAQCCLTYWCMPCALAQVMQRLNLNWLAKPATGVPPKTFFTVFCLTAAFSVCHYALALAIQAVLAPGNSTTNHGYPYDTNASNPEGDIPASFYVLYFLQNILVWAFFAYGLIITIKTRHYIRKKYAIRAQNCDESIEDCCCSLWCPGCVVCQMARHTADYDTYSARCCSSTGLAPDAPAIV